MNNVAFMYNGQLISCGYLNFIPRVGEYIRAGGRLYEVKNVVYDFDEIQKGYQRTSIVVELK